MSDAHPPSRACVNYILTEGACKFCYFRRDLGINAKKTCLNAFRVPKLSRDNAQALGTEKKGKKKK